MALHNRNVAVNDANADLFVVADNGGSAARGVRLACNSAAANPATFTLTFADGATQAITLGPTDQPREITCLSRAGDGTLTRVQGKRATAGQASAVDTDITWR